MKVVEGSKITKPTAPYYVELSNSHATLDKFLSNPDPQKKKKDLSAAANKQTAEHLKPRQQCEEGAKRQHILLQ